MHWRGEDIFLLLFLLLLNCSRAHFDGEWCMNSIKSFLCDFYDHSERMAKNHNIQHRNEKEKEYKLTFHITPKWHINVC